MDTLNNADEFSMVDANGAYAVFGKKGTLLRSNDKPILFIAGENAKYKFLLRSLFVLDGNKLNILLMSQNDMVTPKFFMRVKCIDKNMASIFDKELEICKHGLHVKSQQHFHAELEIPDHLASSVKQVLLKIEIGGASTPFTPWSSDMKSISIIRNSDLLLQFENLVVKKNLVS